MKIRNFISFTGLGLTVGLVCLAGCSTVNTVERAQPTGQKQMTNDKRIITDTGLDRKVNIVGINEATIGSGFAKVQVELFNKSSSSCCFTYHFDWFDAQGMLVQTPTSSWIDRTIQGKETLDIIAVAPTETAKDFRVKFLSK